MNNRVFAWLMAIVMLAIFLLVVLIQHTKELSAAWPFIWVGLLIIIAILVAYVFYTHIWHKTYSRHLERRSTSHEIRRADAELEHKQHIETQALMNAHEIELERLRLAQMQAANEHYRLTTQIELAPGHMVLFPQDNYRMIQAPHKPLPAMQTQQEQALLGAGVMQPSQDWVLGQLPENQLIVSPGVRRSNGEVVQVKIEEVPHIKIIGAPGFGKSCLAGSFMDQLTQLNRPDKLQLALLDIEHKTSRLYENLPHVYEPLIGKRRVPMVGTNAEEVAQHVRYLVKQELAWRGTLPEDELDDLPVLLAYIEEVYALQLEDIDPETMKRMLADINILAARGRKYRVFLLCAMQTDYATEDMRNVQKMFRLRNAAAIDTSAARAAGFMNTELIKENFKNGQFGQFVTEFPGLSDIVYAPAYDVKRLLLKQNSSVRTMNSPVQPVFTEPVTGDLNGQRTQVEQDVNSHEQALQADVQRMIDVAELRAKNWGKIAIIEKVWNVKRGGTQRWKGAEAEYTEIIQALEQDDCALQKQTRQVAERRIRWQKDHSMWEQEVSR